jgi:AhpD family alkylhydroperoxidase
MSRQEILGQIEQTFGMVPDFWGGAPDAVLEQWWSLIGWVTGDTVLSARDKALIAFGAAAAIHCEYCVPFHTAQLALGGMDDEQIKEASWVAQSVTGASAYLYGIGYSKEQFNQELDEMVEHLKKSA